MRRKAAQLRRRISRGIDTHFRGGKGQRRQAAIADAIKGKTRDELERGFFSAQKKADDSKQKWEKVYGTLVKRIPKNLNFNSGLDSELKMNAYRRNFKNKHEYGKLTEAEKLQMAYEDAKWDLKNARDMLKYFDKIQPKTAKRKTKDSKMVNQKSLDSAFKK